MRTLTGCFAFTILLMIGYAWITPQVMFALPWLHLAWFLFSVQSRPEGTPTDMANNVSTIALLVLLAALSGFASIPFIFSVFQGMLIVDAIVCLNIIANSLPPSIPIRGFIGADIERISHSSPGAVRLTLPPRKTASTQLVSVEETSAQKVGE
jgi:hypothetical protein